MRARLNVKFPEKEAAVDIAQRSHKQCAALLPVYVVLLAVLHLFPRISDPEMASISRRHLPDPTWKRRTAPKFALKKCQLLWVIKGEYDFDGLVDGIDAAPN
jgi:hypothetical protein